MNRLIKHYTSNAHALFWRFFFLISGLGYSTCTFAHVKWFAPYNLKESPLHINEVFTQSFFAFFGIFLLLIFIFFLVDRSILYKHKFESIQTWSCKMHAYVEPILRISSVIFFLCLARLGNIILTPELTTDVKLIPALQLFIVITLLSKKTLPMCGFGILYLYCFALVNYGLFHVLDYVIFIGLAGYFIFSSDASAQYLDKKLHINRMTILYISMAFTIMWATIEKFGYAKWSYALLDKHPDITFGLPYDQFLLLAAFVEFSLIFTLITGTYFARLITFGFLSIFIVAIFKFGTIDAIGHLMIMAILLAMSVQGPTKARHFVLFERKNILLEAIILTLLYVVTLFSFFGLYYGLHFIQYQWLPSLNFGFH